MRRSMVHGVISPFMQEYSKQFSYVRPNVTEQIRLPETSTRHSFALPEEFHNTNVMVQIVGAGRPQAQAYTANSLALQLMENYGQLRAADTADDRPLSKAYVKVYARMDDGPVKFYKDGYTDLRGRFDYSSVSAKELDEVERFAILVISERHGAVIREADNPNNRSGSRRTARAAGSEYHTW